MNKIKINDSCDREDKQTQTDQNDLVDPIRYKIETIQFSIELIQKSIRDLIKYQRNMDERLTMMEYYQNLDSDE
jgi:hypothetical protein